MWYGWSNERERANCKHTRQNTRATRERQQRNEYMNEKLYCQLEKTGYRISNLWAPSRLALSYRKYTSLYLTVVTMKRQVDMLGFIEKQPSPPPFSLPLP
jgi:hypothetical protein